MSVVTNQRKKLFHTDVGTVSIVTQEVTDFDVDDAMHLKAMAQAKVLQLINVGRAADINSPSAPRTIKSKYLGNEEELPE